MGLSCACVEGGKPPGWSGQGDEGVDLPDGIEDSSNCLGVVAKGRGDVVDHLLVKLVLDHTAIGKQLISVMKVTMASVWGSAVELLMAGVVSSTSLALTNGLATQILTGISVTA